MKENLVEDNHSCLSEEICVREEWCGCCDVITQVVVLSPATCNVKEVPQLVGKQVDFDVLLYPLLDNESTSGESFGSLQVLAANRQLYQKLTGQNTDIERASTDLTKDDSSDDSHFATSSSQVQSTLRCTYLSEKGNCKVFIAGAPCVTHCNCGYLMQTTPQILLEFYRQRARAPFT